MEAQREVLDLEARRDALSRRHSELAEKQQGLVRQQHENAITKAELELLSEDAKVYKLVGPVMINQSLFEAKDTVEKRLDFIEKESKATAIELKKLEDELTAVHGKLIAAIQKANAATSKGNAGKGNKGGK